MSPRPKASSQTVYRAVPGVCERPVDDELFLVDTRANAVHRLNMTAAMVWRALPRGRREICTLIRAVFPEVSARRIGRDVDAALADLEDIGLIEAEATGTTSAARPAAFRRKQRS